MHGVFFHTVNYVELFRVNDYAEERNLMQQILGIKDVVIMSTDRSHPRLRIYGIPASYDLIAIVKPLVQKCRKENHIYEIANHKIVSVRNRTHVTRYVDGTVQGSD